MWVVCVVVCVCVRVCAELSLVARAVSVLGLVRFLGGFSLVIVVERKPEGRVGSHRIYSIQDYDLVPITVAPENDSIFPWRWLKGREDQVCGCTRHRLLFNV